MTFTPFPMRSNIRQVAARAGVSPSTVSNVLLGRTGNVSPSKREEVLRAIQELEYVPVRPVLQNRADKTQILTLTLANPSQIHFEFHARTYAGICETALLHHYDVLTVLRPDPDWAAERSGIGLLNRRSDGIIILSPTDYANSTLEALVKHGIPTVVCYRRDVPEGIAWVDPDNRQAIFDAVSHLVAAGHTKIAHLTRDNDTRFDFRARQESFLETVKNMGQTGDSKSISGVVWEINEELTPEMARRLFETGVTAVICANDWLAIQFQRNLEAAGLRVPHDISLVGIDDSAPAEQHNLTTMGFSLAEVGSQAVEALLKQIAGQAAEECCREIPLQLIERDSVRTLSRPVK